MRGMGVLGFFGSCGARCLAADKCFAGDIFCICNGGIQSFGICPNLTSAMAIIAIDQMLAFVQLESC